MGVIGCPSTFYPVSLRILSYIKFIFDPGENMNWRSTSPLKTLGVLVILSAWIVLTWLKTPSALAENYEKRTLLNADFSGQVLTDSEFDFANLRGSNFSHTDLHGVSLFGAKLQDVNLEGADLSNSTLDMARFRRTNLKNAILEGAYAYNAEFEGALIEGADFTDVMLRRDAQLTLCKVATGTNPVTGRNTRDTLDCD